MMLFTFQIVSFVIDDYFKANNESESNKGLLIFTAVISFRLSVVEKLTEVSYLVYTFQIFMIFYNLLLVALAAATRNSKVSKKSAVLTMFSAAFLMDYFVFLMPYMDNFWLLVSRAGDVALSPIAHVLNVLNLLILIGFKLPLLLKISDTFILKGSCLPIFSIRIKAYQLLAYIGLSSTIVTRSNDTLYSIIMTLLIILNLFYLWNIINHFYFIHCHSIRLLLAVKIFNCITLIQRLVTSKLYSNIYLFVFLVYFLAATIAYLTVEYYRNIWVFDFKKKIHTKHFKYFIMNLLYVVKRINDDYQDFVSFYINMREHSKLCSDTTCVCKSLIALCSKYKDKTQFKLGNDIKIKSYDFLKSLFIKYKTLNPNDVDILFMELEIDFYIFNKRFNCIQILSFLSDVNEDKAITSVNRIKVYENHFLQKYIDEVGLLDNSEKNSHIDKIFDTEKYIAEMFALFTSTYTLLKTFWIEMNRPVKNFDFIYKACRRIQHNNKRLFELYDILEKCSYKKIDYKYIYASYCYNLLNNPLKAGEIIKEIFFEIETFIMDNLSIDAIEYMIPDCVSLIIRFNPDCEGIIDFCSHNIEHLTGFKRFLVEKQEMNLLIPDFLQHHHKKKVIDLCHSSNITFNHKNAFIQNNHKNLLPCRLSLKLVQNFSGALKFNLLMQVAQTINDENNIEIVFVESVSKKIMAITDGLKNLFETSVIVDPESKEITNQLFSDLFSFSSAKLFDKLYKTDDESMPEFSFPYDELPKYLTNKSLLNKNTKGTIRYKIGEVMPVEDLVFVGIYFMLVKDGSYGKFVAAEQKLRINMSSDNFKQMTKSSSQTTKQRMKIKESSLSKSVSNVNGPKTMKGDANQQHKLEQIVKMGQTNRAIMIGFYFIVIGIGFLMLAGLIIMLLVSRTKIGYIKTYSNYAFNNLKQRNYLYQTMFFSRLYYFLSMEGYQDVYSNSNVSSRTLSYLNDIFLKIDTKDKYIAILKPSIKTSDLIPTYNIKYSRILDSGTETIDKDFKDAYFSLIADTKEIFADYNSIGSGSSEANKLFYSFVANGISQMSTLYDTMTEFIQTTLKAVFYKSKVFELLMGFFAILYFIISTILIWIFYFLSEKKIELKIKSLSKLTLDIRNKIKKHLTAFRVDLRSSASNFYKLTLLEDKYNSTRFRSFMEKENFSKNNSFKLYVNLKTEFDFLNQLCKESEENSLSVIKLPIKDDTPILKAEPRPVAFEQNVVMKNSKFINHIFNRDFFIIICIVLVFSAIIMLNSLLIYVIQNNFEKISANIFQLDNHNLLLYRTSLMIIEKPFLASKSYANIDGFDAIYKSEIDDLFYNRNNSLDVNNHYSLSFLFPGVKNRLDTLFDESICDTNSTISEFDAQICQKYSYYTSRKLINFLDQISVFPLVFKTEDPEMVLPLLQANSNYEVFILYCLANDVKSEIENERVTLLKVHENVYIFTQLLFSIICALYIFVLFKVFRYKFMEASQTFNGLAFIGTTISDNKK